MACFRCGVWNLASFVLVVLTTHVYTADNVEEVPAVDGVKLTCPSSVPAGSPVNWKGLDGSQLNIDNETFADARLSYVDNRNLQMANATPSDNGIYTCVVGIQEGKVNLTVYVTSKPKLKMSFEGVFYDGSTGYDQIRTDINSSQTVTCMVQGAFPMPEIFINIRDHNDSIYSTAAINIQSNQESDNTYTVNASTTVVITDRLYNNRRIECLAVFTFDGQNVSAVKSARFYLNKIEPTIFVYSGFRTLNQSDNTARFTCHGERGRSEIEAVTVYINGEVLAPPYNFSQTPVTCTKMMERDQYYFDLYACNSTIEIYGLTKMDNEKYLNCDFTYQNMTLSGSRGTDQKIDFRYSPEIVQPVSTIYRVYSEEPITIPCSAEANPVANLKWNRIYSDTNTTEVTQDTYMSNGNRLLTFKNALHEHAGEYECHADNAIQPAASQRITLLVIDKSSVQPFDITKLTLSQNSMVLEFNKPTDRVIQYLFLRYTTLNATGEPSFVRETELAMNENENKISVTLSDLQPATTYSLQFREVGAKYGLVATTFLRTVTTPAAAEDEYTRSDVNTAIIISVLVTAVVVILICVIIFCLIKRGACCASSSERYEMQMKPRA